MKSAPAVVLGCLLALSGCGKAAGNPSTPDSAGGSAVAASEVGEHGEKYKGQKVKVVGVYISSFSKGGGPADPWALVIGDAPSSTATVACMIPAKAEIAGRYPKLTAVGTVKADPGDRVYLEGCTYTVEKLLGVSRKLRRLYGCWTREKAERSREPALASSALRFGRATRRCSIFRPSGDRAGGRESACGRGRGAVIGTC